MTATVADTSAPLTLVQGEPIAQRSTRILLGWLNEQEAVQQLLGHNPTPQDDLAAIRQTITAARGAVQARPETRIGSPLTEGDRALVEQVAGRPQVQASFPDVPWRIEWVDLRKVLSVQKLITTDGLDVRVSNAADSDAALVELCLPAEQPVPPLGAFVDHDGLGVTISSLNPNLRAVTSQVADALVAPGPGLPPQKMSAITFLVNLGTSYLQVAHYQGRYFLRDGYHRAAGLLRAGISHVPAVVIEAPSFQYVAPTPGLFDHEVAFGLRPPGLADFWDDTVASDALQPAMRKVVRIRAEQFGVQG